MPNTPGGRRPGAGRKPTADPINRNKSFYLKTSQSTMTQQEVRAALDRVELLEEIAQRNFELAASMNRLPAIDKLDALIKERRAAAIAGDKEAVKAINICIRMEMLV